MFQSFTSSASPEHGAARLASLRARMGDVGVDAVVIPRADAHQGEYVAPCDERLSWLTGFTGSAGFAVVTQDEAGVFIDGRYRTQVRAEVDLTQFSPVNWPETKPADWLAKRLSAGQVLALDPWLFSVEAVEAFRKALDPLGVQLVWQAMVDQVWRDRPARPSEPITVHPEALAGRSLSEKVADVAKTLQEAGQSAAILSLPDSICWLLNLRGADIPKTPVMHAFALVQDDATVDLFTDAPADEDVVAVLGAQVRRHRYHDILSFLDGVSGDVRMDPQSVPVCLWSRLADRADGASPVAGVDPCQLPKACKTAAEIAGARAAHVRDAVAVCEFLAWLDQAAPTGQLTEIDVVKRLEEARRDTGALKDISFDTICGAGPNGAIVHYRVTEDTNRSIQPGELLLVDSGGQYQDGTTDITRTIAVGEVGPDEKTCFTRVLQGMIAISVARFPKGIAGRDLDALARMPLWQAGMDYDHGTGHGVGSYLSVHEGPQRISRVSHVPLQAGMILSNEPGYYREGAFGIRIENLVVVQPAPSLPKADDRPMYTFETLTYVPIDRRLIVAEMLTRAEREWIDSYHADVLNKLSDLVTDEVRAWLQGVCAPI